MAELQVHVPYSAWGSGDEWQDGYEQVLGDLYEAAGAAGVGDDDPDHLDDAVCFYLIGDDVELLHEVARTVLQRHDLLAMAKLAMAAPEPPGRDGVQPENASLGDRRPAGAPGQDHAEAWRQVWASDSDRALHIPRSHLLAGVEYMSQRYSPFDGGEVFDDEIDVDDDDEPTDPLVLGRRDLFHDPAWKTWLDDHMKRDDVELSLRIDEVRFPKVTHEYSERDGRPSFTSWIPVEDLLGDGANEPAVFLRAHCRLYRAMASELQVPEPPPDL